MYKMLGAIFAAILQSCKVFQGRLSSHGADHRTKCNRLPYPKSINVLLHSVDGKGTNAYLLLSLMLPYSLIVCGCGTWLILRMTDNSSRHVRTRPSFVTSLSATRHTVNHRSAWDARLGSRWLALTEARKKERKKMKCNRLGLCGRGDKCFNLLKGHPHTSYAVIACCRKKWLPIQQQPRCSNPRQAEGKRWTGDDLFTSALFKQRRLDPSVAQQLLNLSCACFDEMRRLLKG